MPFSAPQFTGRYGNRVGPSMICLVLVSWSTDLRKTQQFSSFVVGNRAVINGRCLPMAEGTHGNQEAVVPAALKLILWAT